jgi:hypothetical protein
MTMNAGIDIRPILSSVKVPTLVIHRRGDVMIRVEQGRYLAEHVEGARFVELDGIDHLLGAGTLTSSPTRSNSSSLVGDERLSPTGY